MKVLLVDDDEISRQVLVASLSRVSGVSGVVEAEDGEAAWQLLESGLRPALCCCDLVMPNLDGVGLLERARAHSLLAGLPFVMISSAADRESVKRAALAGAAGFIVKPFAVAAVSQTIEKILREARTRQAESSAETRRRLGATGEQLQQMARRWRGEARDLVERRAHRADGAGQSPSPEEAGLESALRRLHSASVLLGQHRCAELLQREIDAPSSQRDVILLEVARMADDWVGDSV